MTLLTVPPTAYENRVAIAKYTKLAMVQSAKGKGSKFNFNKFLAAARDKTTHAAEYN